jgi:hypothetical protein
LEGDSVLTITRAAPLPLPQIRSKSAGAQRPISALALESQTVNAARTTAQLMIWHLVIFVVRRLILKIYPEIGWAEIQTALRYPIMSPRRFA